MYKPLYVIMVLLDYTTLKTKTVDQLHNRHSPRLGMEYYITQTNMDAGQWLLVAPYSLGGADCAPFLLKGRLREISS